MEIANNNEVKMYGKEIDLKLAKKIILDMGLIPGSFFTNVEPSPLCHDYRVETGMYLVNSKDHLVYLLDRKAGDDKIFTTAYLNLGYYSLGMDYDFEDSLEFCDLCEIKVAISNAKKLMGLSADVPDAQGELQSLIDSFEKIKFMKETGAS